MKTSDFERILAAFGFTLGRCGSHRIWVLGAYRIAVPHNRQINRMMAKRLLKEMQYPNHVPEINYFAKTA